MAYSLIGDWRNLENEAPLGNAGVPDSLMFEMRGERKSLLKSKKIVFKVKMEWNYGYRH